MPERDYRELGFRRPVHDEPLTPGLKPGNQRTHAIGFMSGIVLPDEDDG